MRLIDAEKLAEVLNRYLAAPHVQLRNNDISVGLRMGINTCLTFLNNANTIEAEPVRHGRWEFLGPNRLIRDCMCGTCSVCKVRCKYIVNKNICPNCGANMESEE